VQLRSLHYMNSTRLILVIVAALLGVLAAIACPLAVRLRAFETDEAEYVRQL
jgi:hypothetical protein